MRTNRRAQNHLPVNLGGGTGACNSTIGLLGLLLLSYYKIDVNDAVIAIISGLCGSLATLLTTTRNDAMGTAQQPMQTEIVNPPSAPVPTTDTTEPPQQPVTDGETTTIEEH